MVKKTSRKKRDTREVVIKKLLKKLLIKKPRRIKGSKLKNKASKNLKKKKKMEPLLSNKNSTILRKLSARAIQNRNLGY